MTAPSKLSAPRLLAAAAVLSLVAAGCGEGDEARSAGASPRAAALAVTETDFAIAPRDARIEEAGRVRLTVVNRGDAPHALAVQTPDGVVKTATLPAGDRAALETELGAGTYTWFCPIGDHRERGMEGELVVGDGGTEPPAPRGGYGY